MVAAYRFYSHVALSVQLFVLRLFFDQRLKDTIKLGHQQTSISTENRIAVPRGDWRANLSQSQPQLKTALTFNS